MRQTTLSITKKTLTINLVSDKESILSNSLEENAVEEGSRRLGRLKSENYTIEMREFMLEKYGFLNFAHNFWVLYDNRGYIVSEIHGLKTDRKTNKPTHKGWWVNRIQTWIYPLDKQSPIKPNNFGFSGLYRLDQHSRTYLVAPREEIYTHWYKALNASAKITKLDIDYWALLFFCKGGNSNSVARTLADIMGFPYSHITYLAPGSEKNLLIGHCDWEVSKQRNILQNTNTNNSSKDNNSAMQLGRCVLEAKQGQAYVFDLDQFNAQLMLFQVIVNEGKKLYGWLQNFFVKRTRETLSSQRIPQVVFITTEQKAIWKELLVCIETQLAHLNSMSKRKDELRWVWHILEDRKEELEHLSRESQINLEEVNSFTENLQALQAELEVMMSVVSTAQRHVKGSLRREAGNTSIILDSVDPLQLLSTHENNTRAKVMPISQVISRGFFSIVEQSAHRSTLSALATNSSMSASAKVV
ncbi:hypothetical protein [Rickettsiella endosymbiont of Miltochrista miniata]|uniref:hypothetical protein n=1 Tax=Rickettsiella endosymbiont of Miltochrista miniata TaxID=3066239 RepID=UPI00313BB518